ncbi:MAG: PLP-dependent aminotransferase family protein, partial [Sciscionella sp.]
MSDELPSAGRIGAPRLVELLGGWRNAAGRTTAHQLAQALRLLILDGRITVGTELPSQRALADALNVSRTMVTAALDEVRADGLLAARRGSGMWVAQQRRARASEVAEQPELIDLARAAPEAISGLIPAIDAVRARLPVELSAHGYHTYGVPELRAQLAAYYTTRGLPTRAEQILITNGAHSAFVLVLATLVRPGERVLLEDPGYPNAIDSVRAVRAQAVGLAMGEEGWDCAAADAALSGGGIALCYLVPEFQNPTGAWMSVATRRAFGALLRERKTLAVADETLVELDYSGRAAPPPLAAYAPRQVITIGSASKSHWGGLRLGWIRASAGIIDRIASARMNLDLGSPVFSQLLLAELYAARDSRLDGERNTPLEQRRVELSARRDLLCGALREHCPQWRFRVPEGGL